VHGSLLFVNKLRLVFFVRINDHLERLNSLIYNCIRAPADNVPIVGA